MKPSKTKAVLNAARNVTMDVAMNVAGVARRGVTANRSLLLCVALLAAALAGGSVARAAVRSMESPAHTVRPGFGGWWLPYNYSRHGGGIDSLFAWIFWITMITFVAVEVTLVVFLVKYRHDPAKAKGKFIHGNTRLEMAWTLIPAVILAVIALGSKRVWDGFRYSDQSGRKSAEMLVVGEQFKWHVVYPGRDGALGKYLSFPKATDPAFRKLVSEEARKKINGVIKENALGQDPDDPFAKDDDYAPLSPSRVIVVPRDRPVVVRLSSKDVIHDFFLPNFRVKLDAVPGMRGEINFEAQTQSTETIELDKAEVVGKQIWIDPQTQQGAGAGGAVKWDEGARGYFLQTPETATSDPAVKITQVKNMDEITPAHVKAMKAAGLSKVTVITRPFEVVCEELCGSGHTTMRNLFVVLSQQEYDNFIGKGADRLQVTPTPGGTTQPTVSSADAGPVK